MMELDDLKLAWRELDQRLDALQASQERMHNEAKLDKTRSAMRRLASLVGFELISGVPAAVLTGSFLAHHLREARFAIPGVALHAFVLFTIAASVRQLVVLGRLDYAAPVLVLQRRLAAVRASRIRANGWILLLSPLLWTPLAIVAAQGIFGFDVVRGFGAAWVACNLLFGAAVIPLGLWGAHRFAARTAGSPFWKTLGDQLAGRSLAEARRALERIDNFADPA